MSLSTRKLDDLILYLGSSPHVENLGITKLWKLIYFIDVAFLRETGKSLTDSEYIKYDHGPVPSRGDKRLKHLGKEGRVRVKAEDYGSYRQNHVLTVDDLGNGICAAVRESKAIAKRLIGHLTPQHPLKCAMLVACPDSLRAIHFLETWWPIQNNGRSLESDLKVRRGKLMDFSRLHDPINSAALLLTNAESPHEVCHAFVT